VDSIQKLQKKKSVSNGNELKKCMQQVNDGYLPTRNQSIWNYSVESNLLSMPMSRAISSIQLKSSSLTPYCTSCEIQFPKNGRISEVRSQTTFAISHQNFRVLEWGRYKQFFNV